MPLADELKAIITGLEHARGALGANRLEEAEGLWQKLEHCAGRIAKLDHAERDSVLPMMTAVLDELERTMAVFHAEHRHLGAEFQSANRRATAGAAYHKAKGP
ncbi:MAG: hypothetical protein AAFO01_22770 [Pseudomonadota bacterium]